MSKRSKSDVCDKDYLRRQFPRGITIYGIVRHVSKSGLTRRVQLLVVRDGRIVNCAYAVNALGVPCKDGFVTVYGCGFNAVQHAVEAFGRALYGEGVFNYEEIA